MSDADRARSAQSVLFVGGSWDGQRRLVDYVRDTFVAHGIGLIDPLARPDLGASVPMTCRTATPEYYRALEVADGFDGSALHWLYVHDSIRYPLAHLIQGYQSARGLAQR